MGITARGAQSSDIYTINFLSTCGTHQIVDPEFGRCIWNEEDLQEERGSRYLVTPALLAGVRRVAQSVVGERDAECGMTATQLAALMLSIGVFETNPIGEYDVPRSLMFLSRVDRPVKAYPNDDPTATRLADLRAFWHPGVGYWQLDVWANGLNHAERADVDLGGAIVAEYLDDAYCGSPGGEVELRRSLHTAAWNGCEPIVTVVRDGEKVPREYRDGLPVRECFNSFRRIYLGGDLGDSTYRGIEGLWVTTDTPDDPDEHDYWDNETHVDTKGGVQELSCRWGTGTAFDCWLYDTENPEGNISDAYPGGVWYYDPDKDPDNSPPAGYPKGIWTKIKDYRRSPLAEPFISFTDVGGNGDTLRFAVFPESFAYHSQYTNGASQVTWFKHVPVGNGLAFEVRTAPGNTWNENGYDIDANGVRDVLMVEDTSRTVIILGQSRHPWVDVAASDFMTAIRRRYP